MNPTPSLTRHFKGKTVILTGAASGIGMALGRILADAGATLHALDVNAEGLKTLSQSRSVHTHLVNVSDRTALERVISGIASDTQSIDFLFNNAGVTLLGQAQNIPFDRWKWLMDINLMGVVHGTQAVYAKMIRQGHGHIVNTASIAGVTGYATAAAYTTSKAAVLEFSRSLRAEAAAYGIKITVACPGYVDSGIFSQDRIVGADRMEMIDDLPVKMMSPDQAAIGILRGVLKGKRTVIFPSSAHFLWLLAIWAPSLTWPFQKRFLRTFGKKS